MFVAYMPWLEVAGTWISLALCAFIILIVLVQKEKGGGLAGAFGGTGTVSTFGVQTTDVLVRATWFFFAAWVVISMIIAINGKDKGTDLGEQPVVKESPADDDTTPPEPTGN